MVVSSLPAGSCCEIMSSFSSSSASSSSAKIITTRRRRRRKSALHINGIHDLLLLAVVGMMCLFSMTTTTTTTTTAAFVTSPPCLPLSFTSRRRSSEVSSNTRRNTLNKRAAFFITTPLSTTATALHATSSPFNKKTQQQQQQAEEEEEKEALLSDVDARVLREILNDSKNSLDLQTEEGIRSLLKRGIVKDVATPVPPKQQQKEEEEEESSDSSPFSSTAMKAFTDSKLWKKLTRNAEDLLESAKIWALNKIEQDVQTLAALGLFAWDRVVKDVGRALPAAGSSARKLLVLTNTSSFSAMAQEQEQQTNNRMSTLKEELNRPSDEIKTVTKAIWAILTTGASAESVVDGGGRSLRTTAPAGLGNMAERQRRALQQRRKLEKQDRAASLIASMPGSVMNAGYELQRELKAETSVAGYKTKPMRQAVAGTLRAVQESTSRLLQEQRSKAQRLTSSRVGDVSSSSTYLPFQQQQQQQQQQAAVFGGLDKTALLLDLQQERLAIDLRLGRCIAEPENTWLTTDIVAQATMELNEGSLRDIATFMVLVRDEMDAQVQADSTTTNANSENEESNESVVVMDAKSTAMVQEVLDQLRADLRSIQELRSRVAGAVSVVIADELYRQIMGLWPDEDDELPLMLRLDEIQEQLNAPPPPPPPPHDMPFSEKDNDGYDFVASSSTMPFFTAPTKFVDVTNAKKMPFPFSSRAKTTTAAAVKATAIVDPAKTATPWWRPSPSATKSSAFIDFVDLLPDAVIDATMDGGRGETTATVGDAVAAFVDVGGKSFNAEIVSDNDFDFATKRVATFRGDDADADDAEKQEEPNLVTVAFLRSLDVVFFVVEKFFTVAVPKAVIIGTNVVQRLAEAQQEGKGSKGWKAIRQTVSAKGRY